MIQTKIRELNKSIEAKREQLKQFQADKINFKNELSRQVTCERKYLLSEFL
jgi:molecular chaperone GrpE (heat shock protein)